jgi:hypothetical protein
MKHHAALWRLFVATYNLPVSPPCQVPPVLLAWGIVSKTMKLAMVGNYIQADATRSFETDSEIPILVDYGAVGGRYTQDIHKLM